MSVHFWSLISYEVDKILCYTEEHLQDLHYQHNVTNMMVLSIRLLYPDRVIWFWQNHSFFFHNSSVVQEWLSVQADVKLIKWLPWAPDMNHIKDMWNEGDKALQECGPFFLWKTDSLWPLWHMLGVQWLNLILILTPKLSLYWDKCNPWLQVRNFVHCIKDAMPWKQPFERLTY